MNALTSLHIDDDWILKADVGDHLPDIIYLIHNETLYKFKRVKK